MLFGWAKICKSTLDFNEPKNLCINFQNLCAWTKHERHYLIFLSYLASSWKPASMDTSSNANKEGKSRTQVSTPLYKPVSSSTPTTQKG